MKRLLFSLLMIFVSIRFADSKPKQPHHWNKGTVIFNNGDSMQCELRFTRRVAEGLLQIRKDDKVQILTVKQVAGFRFLDRQRNTTRKFFNVTMTPELSTRRHEVFVELVYDANGIAIMNHKTLGYSPRSFQINPFRKKSVVNSFYMVEKETGLILPLTKDAVLQVMDKSKGELEAYIQSNNVRLRTVSDYISLLEYGNTLK